MMRKIMKVFFVIWLISFPVNAGELINQQLPSYLKADIQLRYRMEFKENLDFNDQREDKDGYHLLRTRINAEYTPIKEIQTYVQLQDSRGIDMQNYAENTVVHYMDLRQAHLSLKDVIKSQGAWPHTQIIFGRQSLHLGAGRLMGDPDWSNIGQTFDAGRVALVWDNLKVKTDLFGGNLTANKSPREANDFYDHATKDTMGGYYFAWSPDKVLTVEQYLINRKTNKNISFGPSGNEELEEYTSGGRIIAKGIHGFDYEMEIAGQWGNFGTKDIKAMMMIALVGYTFDMPWNPRAGFEFDYASGDSDASDNTRGTFDNLYPANHNYYGYMDLISLQNLNDYRYSLSINPNRQLRVTSDLHVIYLDNPKDSFYSAAKSVTRTARTTASDHVGNEIDLWASYKMCDLASMTIGYSHLFAGGYLADTGANDDADFFYTSFTLNF